VIYTKPLTGRWRLVASATFNGEWGGYQGPDGSPRLDDHEIVGRGSRSRTAT